MDQSTPPGSRRGFTKVPRALIDHPDIGAVDIAVYVVIRSHDHGSHPVFPGQRRIAKMLGYDAESRRKVQEAIDTLERIGAMGVERQVGRGGNHYTFPDEFARPLDESDFDGDGTYNPVEDNPVNGVTTTPFPVEDNPVNGVTTTPFDAEEWGHDTPEMGSETAEMGSADPVNGVTVTPEVDLEVEEVDKGEVRRLPATTHPPETSLPKPQVKPEPEQPPAQPFDIDVLRAEHITDAATLGRRIAELCNDGAYIQAQQFDQLIDELPFGADERWTAWDGYYQHRFDQRQETA